MARTVLVTGGSSGIGLGIAKGFAKAGYYVAINGLEKNGADIAADMAKEFGVKTLFHGANMMDPAQLATMVQDVEKAIAPIDILVHSAGVQFVSPIQDFPVDKYNLIISVNQNSVWHMARLLWPGWLQRKFGRLIAISSVHGLVASEFKSAYIMSKHAVIGLTKTLALEGANNGITANAICPGYVWTPLVEGQIKDQAKSHAIPEEKVISDILLKKHAIKDFVTIESLSQMALFLASDNGGTTTGIAIPMDGGWTAQ